MKNRTFKNDPLSLHDARQRFRALGLAVFGHLAFSRGCRSVSRGAFCRGGKNVRLANSAAGTEREEGPTFEFEVLQGEWVQLAPYGQFPHPRGLQVFDKSDAETLVANFHSLKETILRRFGGLPWYEGHPDTSPKDYPNKRAYGWIDEVQARNDGLYAHVKWTAAGNDLIAGGHYKFFSPVWDAKPATLNGKKVFRPIRLISCGFTNTPNMPVLPLANEEQPTENDDMKLPPFLKKFLGFDNAVEPDDEAIETAAQKKAEELENAKKKPDGFVLPNELPILQVLGFAPDATPTAGEIIAAWSEKVQTPLANAATLANDQAANATALENVKTEKAKVEGDLKEATDNFAAERSERIELLVGLGIAGGKITKAQADQWRTDLKADFETKSVELANAKPSIKTSSVTEGLGREQSALEEGATPGETARALANAKMQEKGISFDSAWRQIKRERGDLFANMKQPGAAA